MEQRNNHHNNGLGNGFLLGVIVGVIVTLLFTTKKGREIFKELAEKGLDKFSDLEEMMHETTERIDEENDNVKPESRPAHPEPVKEVRHLAEGPKKEDTKQETRKEETKKTEEHHSAPEKKPESPIEEKTETSKSHGRRFFRLRKN